MNVLGATKVSKNRHKVIAHVSLLCAYGKRLILSKKKRYFISESFDDTAQYFQLFLCPKISSCKLLNII